MSGAATRDWTRAGLSPATVEALARGLSGSALWSLLLGVAEQRAAQGGVQRLMRQWSEDRFVQPGAGDQRRMLAVDAELLAAAAAFEAIELSPLAPLGTCSVVARGSQNRIVSTLRGTEVLSDPTNVLALACARRLQADAQARPRLATSHRCVRAQPVPKRPGHAAHFRLFCLATAGAQTADQAFTVEALAEHIGVHLAALDRLEARGHAFGRRVLRLLHTPARAELARRLHAQVAAARPGLEIESAALTGDYYDGLRFMVDVHTADGFRVPLIDGGAFDWLQRLLSNRKRVFVASGLGSQLALLLFGPP